MGDQSTLHLGDVTITALRDGTCHLPPMFFPGQKKVAARAFAARADVSRRAALGGSERTAAILVKGPSGRVRR